MKYLEQSIVERLLSTVETNQPNRLNFFHLIPRLHNPSLAHNDNKIAKTKNLSETHSGNNNQLHS